MNENLAKAITRGTLSFASFSRRCLQAEAGNVAWSILFSILGIATSLASSYTLKILVDDVLVGHHVEWLWPIQGIFILAVMIGNGFRMLEQHFALRAAKNITGKLRIAMFERLLVGQLSGLRKTNPGDFTSSLLYDAGSVFDHVSGAAIGVYSAVLHICLSLALMVYLSPILTAMTLLIIPLMMLVFSTLDRQIGIWNNRLIQERKKVSGSIHQVLGALVPIRAMQTEGLQREQFAEYTTAHLNVSHRLSLLYFFYSMATWMLIMVPYQALMYGVGGTLFFRTGAPTIGLMLTFANYANGLLGPLQTVANYRRSKASVEAGYDNLIQTLQIPEERSGNNSLAEQPAGRGLEVEWQGLSFQYEEGAEESPCKVLQYPNSRIPANQITLLKGPSGSGKSTFLNILFGLYPYEKGQMQVNGQELAELNLITYRRTLSFIPQEPVLLGGTVRFNLQAVAPEVTEEEMLHLLERFHLRTGSGSLAQGLDTEVGTLGQSISVGQRQRLMLAQGLLRKSRLFIFDEPNSALDAESSQELADMIRELKQEATVLICSHDAMLQALADVVIEL